MYAPNSVPEGPHHVYIFQDQTRPWFKIGESRNPDERRKEVTWDIHGGNSLHKLKEYRKWTFQNYYAGIHVEQAAITLLKNLGLSPIRRPDWFEIDSATVDALTVSIDELARSIIVWEEMNGAAECEAHRKEKPYGQYLHDNYYLPVQHWYEVEPGKFEPMDGPIEERAARMRKYYVSTKKKMPEKLAKLIEAIELNAVGPDSARERR